MNARWLRGRYAWVAYAILASLLVGGGISVWWLSRYTLAVHRLTRGVGDTVFYGADGQPVVPARRAAARRAARRDRAGSAARRPRDRGSPLLPPSRASTRSASRAPWCATCSGGGRVEGGSTLTQQLARTLFLSNVRTYRPQGQGSGHRAAHRAAAHEEADPRALSQSRLPERRRVRRRDDVGAPVPQVGAHADAAGGRVDRRADSRAVGAVAVVQLRRRARAQPYGARADARAGLHHAGAGGSRAPRRGRASSRSGQPSDTRAALGQGIPPPAVSQRVRRRSSARLAGAHVVPAGDAGRRRARRCRRARTGWAARDSRRRSSPSIRRPAIMLAMVGGAELREEHVQSRDTEPPAAGIGVQADRVRRGAVARLFAGLGACRTSTACRRLAIRNGAAKRRARRRRDPDSSDAARGARSNRTTPPLRCCSSRSAAGTVLRLAADAGLQGLPDVPSLALGTGRGHAARSDSRLHDVSRRRRGRASAGDARACSTPTARRCSTSRSRTRRVIERGRRVPDGEHAARRDRSRDRQRRRARWACAGPSAGRPARPTTITTRGSSAFRRRSSSACGSASISRRRSGATRTAPASRCRSGPIS